MVEADSSKKGSKAENGEADSQQQPSDQQNNPEEESKDREMEDGGRSAAQVERPRQSGKRREEFYLRYYVGHKGKFGHEFLEFEFQQDGRLRYANNSQYKAENLIRKEVYVNELVIEELKRIIHESEIFL